MCYSIRFISWQMCFENNHLAFLTKIRNTLLRNFGFGNKANLAGNNGSSFNF